MKEVLKLLRYNTGTDKASFLKFNKSFDGVIFNASILAHNVSAITDLIAVYEDRYIVDPQTYIFQITKEKISKRGKIKESINKYLDNLPQKMVSKYKKEGELKISYIISNIKDLVDYNYNFQVNFVNNKMKEKDYAKYLDYVGIIIKPKMIIAPYLMINSEYEDKIIDDVLDFNIKSIELTEKKARNDVKIACQLVINKKALSKLNIEKIKNKYKNLNIDYIFVWISDFNMFTATKKENEKYKELILVLNNNGLKPIMSYGGYDSIILCNKDSKIRLYGVANSIGYGEKREIVPVGGGIPVIKYYFYPIHQRLNMEDVLLILKKSGFSDSEAKMMISAEKYYKEICDCNQCKKIIKNDFTNFKMYRESTSFSTKDGIAKERPTYNTTVILNTHFMYCKIKEWKNVNEKTFTELKRELINNHKKYNTDSYSSVMAWAEMYE